MDACSQHTEEQNYQGEHEEAAHLTAAFHPPTGCEVRAILRSR